MRSKNNPRKAALLALAFAPRALFAATQSNLTSPNTLDHTLHFLYIAVAVMVFVFVLVAALAYAAYRKARQETLTPDGSDDSTR